MSIANGVLLIFGHHLRHEKRNFVHILANVATEESLPLKVQSIIAHILAVSIGHTLTEGIVVRFVLYFGSKAEVALNAPVHFPTDVHLHVVLALGHRWRNHLLGGDSVDSDCLGGGIDTFINGWDLLDGNGGEGVEIHLVVQVVVPVVGGELFGVYLSG